jgi:hypothetical protein
MWSRASFRIAGDTLDPEKISSCLELEASLSCVKGEQVRSGFRAVRRTSIWILRCPLDKLTPMEEHVKWLLNLLEPKAAIIKALADRFSIDLFCGFLSEIGQGGFTLDARLLQRIASLGIAFSLDLYPPESAAEAAGESDPGGDSQPR